MQMARTSPPHFMAASKASATAAQVASVAGFIRTSLVDYPGYVCSTVFLSGCNFRCPYCHNRDLVTGSSQLQRVPLDQVLNFLENRITLLDGVCITGGEPTLTADLPILIRAIKDLGLRVKLDTNGTNPDMLEKLLADSLVDYVAMDIKAPPRKYGKITKATVRLADIQAAIDLLREATIEYEFRTTVVPKLLMEEDLLAIGRWLEGAFTYVIQQFRPRNTLDPNYESLGPYPPDWLETMAGKLRPYFKSVRVRGIGA